MIHKYEQNGFFIVLDVYSGAVHAVDEMVFAMLDHLKPPLTPDCPPMDLPYDRAAVEDAYGELFALYENGTLFAADTYGNLLPSDMPLPPIKAACLHVSHDCNLRCKYCFAETGDFGGARRLMDAETAKRAIDFIVKASGGRRNIEIDFFGGEPLLAMETVKQTVQYANAIGAAAGKNFRFTITTNGVLLCDDTIDYINETMSNVVLSLDGRKCVNDAIRPRVDGSGSYDKIVPRFQRLAARRKDKDYYIRGTFTADNLDFFEDIEHIAALGFSNISLEPVMLPSQSPFALQHSHLPAIYAQYDKLASAMLAGDASYNFFHFNVDLQQGPCVIKRMRGCGAGCEYVAITPEGDIYPCHQFVGKTEFLLGSLTEGIQNAALMRRFAESGVYGRHGCADCFAKFYCSGGCMAANHLIHGDMSVPYEIGCLLEKKRLQCAIMLAVAKSMERVGERG